MTGTRRAVPFIAAVVAVLGLAQLAQGRGVTSLCQFEMRFMSVNDSNQDRAFTVGYDPAKNKLRADILSGPDDDPSSCEDPDPWNYFELNLSKGDDGARLDAFNMPNAYKPLPKGIEGYLIGGMDADVLIGHRGYDALTGDAGRDRLLAGDGFDELDGGSGRDFVSAGRGGDGIYVDDGRPGDEVHCGKGDDGVLADAGDQIANDCETVR